MSFYRDVIRSLRSDDVFDPVSFCVASRMSAVIRSLKGDHRGAIADLERLLPFARVAGAQQPHTYYDYLNNLAVEFGEVGRLKEAGRISRLVVASPYAAAYPEWQETLDEINSKTKCASRSIVGVSQVPSKQGDSVLQISSLNDHLRRAESPPQHTTEAANIISLEDWKMKKFEKNSRNITRKKPTLEELRFMDLAEKQATITRYVYGDEVTEEMLDSILEVTATPNTGDSDGA
jgi:hypothetical protein